MFHARGDNLEKAASRTCGASSSKRMLLYAETPFQIFSELCLYFALKRKVDTNSITIDFIVADRFEEAPIFVKRLSDLGIFENVWVIPQASQHVKHFGLSFYADYFLRKRKTREWFFNQYPMLNHVIYDVLVIAAPLRALAYLKWFCAPDCVTLLIEDGTGTYSGDMFDALTFLDDVVVLDDMDSLKVRLKHLTKKLLKLLTGRNLLFQPRDLYLFNISDSVKKRFKNLSLQINPLPSDEDWEIVERVFPIKSENLYKSSDYFFLATTDLDDESAKAEEVMFDFINCATPSSLVLRSHPRERKAFKSEKEYSVDSYGDLWEMLCAKKLVDDQSVLCSACSTAQVNPKLIFGSEPYLVFLYEVLPQRSSFYRATLRKTSDEVRRMYSDSSKVFVPRSMEELRSVLEAIEARKDAK